MIIIISLIVCIIPSIILYKWLKKRKDDEKYQELCHESLKKGILTIFPILLLSIIFNIIGKLISGKINPIYYQAYYNFIVLAFSEEIVKFLTFKRILKKNKYKYTWFDVTVFMTIVSLGFGCIENVVFSLDSSIISMLIRGLSLGHAGYGFIMGFLYGKMLKTGKKLYGILCFLIPLLLHGFYDFGLSKELLNLSDNFAFISVSLELICIITAILIIRFVRKKQASDIYKTPLKIN